MDTKSLIGYIPAVILAGIGAVTFGWGLNVVLSGSTGDQSITAMVSLVVASVLFAAATFILLATVIFTR